MNVGSDALDRVTDCIVVLDGLGQVLDANAFMLDLMGYRLDEVVGRSMADFVAPEDLDRAIRVMEMVAGDTLDVPTTPALYRVKRRDGSWLPIEINGTGLAVEPAGAAEAAGSGDTGTPAVLLIGRYSADRDLQDRVMARLVSGESPTAIIDLIPEFGRWRHQLDHYAVVFTDDQGAQSVIGSEVITGLPHLDDPETPWDIASRTGEQVVMDRADMSPSLRDDAVAHDLTSCWAVPVPDPLYERAAVIVVWCRAGGPDVEVHRYAVETMARSLAVILQWRHQVTSLTRAARRDPLTGLVNRTGFWEVLDALAREQSAPLVAVLYVDLDGFKAINDVYGHRSGDLVLTEVAQRIMAAIRPGDTIARLGGDEFAIVCRDLANEAESIAIAERVLEVVAHPVDLDGQTLDVGASVGIATVLGHELRPDELLDSADHALYQAKRAGRGGWYMAPARGSDEEPGSLGG